MGRDIMDRGQNNAKCGAEAMMAEGRHYERPQCEVYEYEKAWVLCSSGWMPSPLEPTRRGASQRAYQHSYRGR